ncbi:MAG: thiol protease/hemagglutinin PrtT [Prevotellaceae bacterium]|jgi:hypothetical protein|nr:thiol protease/hemagglutinin PrtT [Prevotellaceae bacterium]
MKKLFLTIVTVLFNFSLFANSVDIEQAKIVGKTFLQWQNILSMDNGKRLNLAHATNFSFLRGTTTEQSSYIYIFNLEDGGFVIVSADDRIMPVLGYADKGSINFNNLPPNARYWLASYERQIEYAIEHNIQPTAEISEQWTNLFNGRLLTPAQTASVSPLLTTEWNQSPYYNILCPYDAAQNALAVTGCVATAMAQIMKYWNYPVRGTGTHSYTEAYGTLSADFANAIYDWENMPNIMDWYNVPTARQLKAVGKLMYHCGVAANMSYSPLESGAQVFANSGGHTNQYCAENAFKNFFGYKNTIRGEQRNNNETAWINLLKTELDASRPVLYCAYSQLGGHAFVCDGYNSSNYFHFNWGWGGSANGYFSINNMYGYDDSHGVLVGIEPSAGIANNYILRLNAAIVFDNNIVEYGSPVSLSVGIKNNGTDNFSGKLSANIFDGNGNFIDALSTINNVNLSAGSNQTFNFSNYTTAFVPNNYSVSIYYQSENGLDWKKISDAAIANLAIFSVEYSSDITVNSSLNTNLGNYFIQNQNGQVSVQVQNFGTNTFAGKYRLTLAHFDGTTAQEIEILNETDGLLPNATRNLVFAGNITAEAGKYVMAVSYQQDGSQTWNFAGGNSYKNPVYINVQPSYPLLADAYENNNNRGIASLLPLNFIGDNAKIIVSANIHSTDDLDFYKISLPAGDTYSVSARLYDAYNSGNEFFYTLDAAFSYSLNLGNTWAEFMDDLMLNNLIITGSKTLFFQVKPFFIAETGTYKLEINVNKNINTDIKEVFYNNNNLIIFPNPVKDNLYVETNTDTNDRIQIIDIFGKILLTADKQSMPINVSNLPKGIYILKIGGNTGKFIKQ